LSKTPRFSPKKEAPSVFRQEKLISITEVLQMTISHAYQENSSATNELFTNLSNEFSLISHQIKSKEFSQLEKELHQKFAQAEREAMKQLLESYDWCLSKFKSEDGQSYVHSSRNKKRYMTLAGEVIIERSLYRAERNGPTFCPLELNTGLIEGFWSPQAAKQAIQLVSQLTPVEVESIFKEFGLMNPSKSSLDRLPKKLIHHEAVQQLNLEEKLQEQFDIPKSAKLFAISLDGVMVHTRYSKVLPGDSAWSEASCGTVSFYDDNGVLLNTRYMGRMPEHKKKTLKQQLIMQVQKIHCKRPELTLIKVADGARDNWSFFENEVIKGECVLDFYHACEHLHHAMKLIYGKNEKKLVVAFAKYRDILLNDFKGISKVINHLKYQMKKYPTLKKLQTELTYFSRNKKRCEYARLKSENKPIGSGVVESACKQVVQMRLKRSGQHWNDNGGQAILTFRSIVLSHELDNAWDVIKKSYIWPIKIKPIETPNNVIQFRKIN